MYVVFGAKIKKEGALDTMNNYLSKIKKERKKERKKHNADSPIRCDISIFNKDLTPTPMLYSVRMGILAEINVSMYSYTSKVFTMFLFIIIFLFLYSIYFYFFCDGLADSFFISPYVVV